MTAARCEVLPTLILSRLAHFTRTRTGLLGRNGHIPPRYHSFENYYRRLVLLPLGDEAALRRGLDLAARVRDIIRGLEPVFRELSMAYSLAINGDHRAAMTLAAAEEPLTLIEQNTECLKAIHMHMPGVGAIQASGRRRLTSSQLAVIALGSLPIFEKQAKQRQLGALNRAVDTPEGMLGREMQGPRRGLGEARELAAAAVGCNPHYVSDAKRIARVAPHLLTRLRAGELTVPAAMRKLRRR